MKKPDNLRPKPTYKPEKNVPYTVYLGNSVKVPKGSKVTLEDGTSICVDTDSILFNDTMNKKVVYAGRYCCVSTFVFAVIDGTWCVLANLRGEGTPDYKHCWNCVCGFLEGDETARQGASREVYEETSIDIDPKDWEFIKVQDEPMECNNGHVSFRFRYVMKRNDRKFFNFKMLNKNGGEEDEVEDLKWIPIRDVSKYNWAFDHAHEIYDMFNSIPLHVKIATRSGLR